MSELIIALDFSSRQTALAMARMLAPCSSWFKVGLELFVSAGPAVVHELREMGCKVFLDLKFYDIPNTCAGAARAACVLGVDMLTIHCQGGKAMAEAVIDAVQPFHHRPLIVGVTALTSFGPGQMPGIQAEPGIFGQKLADLGASWGLHGIVCSAREAAVIKEKHPGLLCVCPGIRPGWAEDNDQARIVTPAQAVGAGADFLVVGRPVTHSPNPLEAARKILEEMESIYRNKPA